MVFARLLFVALFFALCYGATAQEIRILETGGFHGEEITAKDGEIWLGVYERSGSYMLMPSILAVESVYDGIIDAIGETSGKRISVPGMGDPLFLVKGKGFEQARPVPTIDLTTKDIAPGFDESISFNDREYRLWVESNEKGTSDFISSAATLIFSNGKMRQVIYEVKECSFCRWRVDWAGDIDSDGKPDFYMFLTDHYNVANKKLFLSSMAENGRLVREVSEFTTTGC